MKELFCKNRSLALEVYREPRTVIRAVRRLTEYLGPEKQKPFA
jgi:hypothetical protein